MGKLSKALLGWHVRQALISSTCLLFMMLCHEAVTEFKHMCESCLAQDPKRQGKKSSQFEVKDQCLSTAMRGGFVS